MGQDADKIEEIRAPEAAEDARTRVFLSYSRKDGEVMGRIAEGLQRAGFLADFDKASHDPHNVTAGISAEDEWWKRLQEMIAAADVMAFLVSPDSATSAVCDEEIAYARALGKRIIAVLARPVDFAKAPPRLSALNVRIDFSESGPGFDAALAGLVTALEMNVGWHREGRKYYARVQEWDVAGRPKSRLLREGAVEEVQRWALARPRNEPEPGELFLAWIAASREQIKRDAARRAFWRRVTGLFVMTTLAAVLLGAWFVVRGQRNLGRSESLMLARTADQFYNNNDYLHALHLAILASRDSFLSPATAEAKAAFAKSAQALELVRELDVSGGAAVDIVATTVAASGKSLLVELTDGSSALWSLETAERLAGPFTTEVGDNGMQKSVSADGSLIVLYWGEVAYALRAEAGEVLGPFKSDPDAYLSFGMGVPFADGSKFLLRDQKDGVGLRDGTRGERLAVLGADLGMIIDAQVSVDGQIGLIAGQESYQLWNLETLQPLRPASPYPPFTVQAFKLSPDGTRLLVPAEGGIRYLDVATGREIALDGPAPPDTAEAEFVPEAGRFVLLDGDHHAQIRDTETGALVGEPVTFESTVEPLKASIEGGRLVALSYLTGTRVYSLATGELLSYPAEGETPAQAAVLVPGTNAYLTFDGRSVQLRFSQDGESVPETLIEEHPGFIEDLTMSPDGRAFLTFTSDGEVRQWETESGLQIGGPWKHTNYYSRSGYLGNGDTFLTVTGAKASVWASRPYTQRAGPLIDGAEPATSSLMSPDGRFLFAWNQVGRGVMWDLDAGEAIGPGILTGEEGFWGSAFDPAGSQLALWYENQLQLIPTATGVGGEALAEHQDVVTGGAFTEDGTRLVTVDMSGMVYVWDTATLAAVGEPRTHEAYALPPVDGVHKRMLLFAGEVGYLIDLTTGDVIGAPLAHGRHGAEDESAGLMSGGALSGNGEVAMTFTGEEVRLWDAATGAQKGEAIFNGAEPRNVKLSADGSRVMVLYEKAVEVFDTATGNRAGRFAEEQLADDGVLNSDGTVAATWSGAAKVQIWDVGTAQARGNPYDVGLAEQTGMFTPDGTRILMIEPSGTFRIADAATGDVLSQMELYAFAGGVWQPEAGQLLTHRYNGETQVWDISAALRSGATEADAAEVCRAKLAGSAPVRQLDAWAIFAAPILRGREGEDVCAPPRAPWWDRAAGLAFGWMFN
ncbi:TIR domain-containing protein [Hyphomonas sp.]|uniref:toll/interleukin-1 receptor domain-containing protein n=1 Tax=Hyphomonas sp. TaxID=87 RepID=UPI0025C00E49|nr:TIR domain-containing protein [Hyphomonas sp.]MBI1399215.1 TIR domain-containing protein [Hyphomonas sp.]